MKRFHFSTLLLPLLGLTNAIVFAADFPRAGFSIEPLDRVPDKTPLRQVAMFFLPWEDGFAPNVGVMMNGAHSDMKGFIAATRGEFATFKMQVLSDREMDDGQWVVEYTGMQEVPGAAPRKLRFYMRAMLKNGSVYFATATCPDTLWEKNQGELKACVDSLRAK